MKTPWSAAVPGTALPQTAEEEPRVRPLRIGLIAPPWFAVPPKGYGGIELVVSYLADGLVERGHEVTLFAAGGSATRARLVTPYGEEQAPLIGDAFVEARHLLDAYACWQDFDVIHDHTLLGLLAGAQLPLPVVHTIHGPVTDRVGPLYERLAHGVELVAISENQRSTLPPGVDATVIHNGIDTDSIAFREQPGGDYLVFVGRMSPEKGVAEAIDIARAAGMPLLILAKINEEPERRYYQEVVLPRVAGGDVEVLEHASPQQKFRAYRGALATLFPIQWPEPFGLVMIESMATGTPVIAMRRGSAPEVIEDGVTGFLCDSLDEAVDAVSRVRELSRLACRERTERLFNARSKVAAHEELYWSLVSRSVPPLDAWRTAAPAVWLQSSK
ncbi:MAG: glycosyltransferase family 4 protein [Dehalococcoidia bacterium]|nr:glycosyltransferase family 4 protein [Dehalococcoidia bacterium]